MRSPGYIGKRHIPLEGADVTLKFVTATLLQDFLNDNKVQEYLVRRVPVTFVHQNYSASYEPCNCTGLGKAVQVLAKEKLSSSHFAYVPVEILFQDSSRFQYAIAKISTNPLAGYKSKNKSNLRKLRHSYGSRSDCLSLGSYPHNIINSHAGTEFELFGKPETPIFVRHGKRAHSNDPIERKWSQKTCLSPTYWPDPQSLQDLVMKVLLKREFGPHKAQFLQVIRDIAKESEVSPTAETCPGDSICANFSNRRSDPMPPCTAPQNPMDNVLKSILISRLMQNQSMHEKRSSRMLSRRPTRSSPTRFERKKHRSNNLSSSKVKSLNRVHYLVNSAISTMNKGRGDGPKEKVLERKMLCGQCANCVNFFCTSNNCHAASSERNYEMVLTIARRRSPSGGNRHESPRKEKYVEFDRAPFECVADRRGPGSGATSSGSSAGGCDFIAATKRINCNNNNHPSDQEEDYDSDTDQESDGDEVFMEPEIHPRLLHEELEIMPCLFQPSEDEDFEDFQEHDSEETYKKRRASVIHQLLTH